MIPIQDTIRARRWPVVNWAVMALCGYVFWLEFAGGDPETFLREHAVVPRTILALLHRGSLRFAVPPVFWSMFMHGGLAHIGSNMLFLWIFGDNVEDRMGHLGYALFYLIGGVVATATQIVLNPGSAIPLIGASGAIAAVMGAYLLLYPGSRIRTLVWVLFLIRVVDVPAYAWLGFWFLMQLLSSSAPAHGPDQGGVAFFAHIGGFAFGALTVLLLGLRGEPPPRAQEWR